MPEVGRFFGIIIAMYYIEEHEIPYFHAKYAGRTDIFSIPDLSLLGRLPRRVIALVLEWPSKHREVN